MTFKRWSCCRCRFELQRGFIPTTKQLRNSALQRRFDRPARRGNQGIEIERRIWLGECDADRLQSAEIVEPRVDQFAFLKEEHRWAFWVFDQKASGLLLMAQDADQIRKGILVEVSGQNYKTIVLHYYSYFFGASLKIDYGQPRTRRHE